MFQRVEHPSIPALSATPTIFSNVMQTIVAGDAARDIIGRRDLYRK
jgi:hypothetical protein